LSKLGHEYDRWMGL